MLRRTNDEYIILLLVGKPFFPFTHTNLLYFGVVVVVVVVAVVILIVVVHRSGALLRFYAIHFCLLPAVSCYCTKIKT